MSSNTVLAAECFNIEHLLGHLKSLDAHSSALQRLSEKFCNYVAKHEIVFIWKN